VLESPAIDREVILNNKKKIAIAWVAIGVVVIAIAGVWGTYSLSTRSSADAVAAEQKPPAGVVNPDATNTLRAEPVPQRADPFEIPPTDALGTDKGPPSKQ
jgi:hypothetical protein